MIATVDNKSGTDTIIRCMERNIANANTKALRDYYVQELCGFKERMFLRERQRRCPSFIQVFVDSPDK